MWHCHTFKSHWQAKVKTSYIFNYKNMAYSLHTTNCFSRVKVPGHFEAFIKGPPR